MKISDICRYYIKCISLESNTTVRVSLKETRFFHVLPSISQPALELPDSFSFLSSNLEKEKDLLLGYPLLKSGHFLSPLFIIKVNCSIDNKTGRKSFSLDDEIQLNKDIVDKYSTNEKSENIYELRDLEAELGFSEGTGSRGFLQDRVDQLRHIRPSWEWVDNLELIHLNASAITRDDPDGILNRAILFAKDPTPYTVGLSNELAQIQEMDEDSLRLSVFGKMLHGHFAPREKDDKPILEVLPLNTEQREAIKTALENDLTIIAGPPGTGKTQVVANLIINAALRGQNVLFTSKNNNAVDVVVKRVNSFHKKLPLMIRYEKSVKECLTDYANAWTSYRAKEPAGKPYMDEYEKIFAHYNSHIEQKKEIVDARNRLDELDEAIMGIRERYDNLIGSLSDSDIVKIKQAFDTLSASRVQKSNGPHSLKDKLFAKKWRSRIDLQMTEATEYLGAKADEMGFPLKPSTDMSEREWQQYEARFLADMTDWKQIADYNFNLSKLRNSETLEQIDATMLTEHVSLQKKAKEVWEYWLDRQANSFNSLSRGIFQNYLSLVEHGKIDDYPPGMRMFLPACAITALSARRRLPFRAAVYDLLIIDEASQCDIASMVPMLMRAKRVAVIGDKNQLSHICLINKSVDLALMESLSIEPRWSYLSNSVYDLASGMADPENFIQLRDHHRSHLDIIQFSNKEFYDNTLRIATDYRRLESPNNGIPIMGVQWMNVVGKTVRPETGGAYNYQEAEGVIRILRRLNQELDFKGSIGVTTPFRLQAEMIKRALEGDSDFRNSLETQNKLLIDTVHKFQGDERDVIVFSPVISQGAMQQSVQFLKSTGNIFNVAITRARSLLVTVGDKEYCKHCGVSYLEHFAEYDAGQNAPVESSEWEHMFQKALSEHGIPATAQYHVDKYYLDLALFHNGKKLDIEIDGAMYHQTWSYELCYSDQIRNQALMQQGWDVMRFWVQQIRDQMPWCIEQVTKWMESTEK